MADLKISALPASTVPLVGTELAPIVQSGATKQVTVSDLTAGRAVSMLSLTADTNTLVVDSTNRRTGVGTTSPGAKLQVTDTTSAAATALVRLVGQNSYQFNIQSVTSSDSTIGARVNFNINSGSGEISLSNSSVAFATFKSTGDIAVSTGNVIIGTSGKGIDFSATPSTGTSELFADYEEGLHTTTLTPSTSGTITLTGSGTDALGYTKIGRVVTITGYIEVASVSSPVGTLVRMSLPFTVLNSFYPSRFGGAVNAQGALIVYDGAQNTAFVNLRVDASTMSAGKYFFVSFSYIAA